MKMFQSLSSLMDNNVIQSIKFGDIFKIIESVVRSFNSFLHGRSLTTSATFHRGDNTRESNWYMWKEYRVITVSDTAFSAVSYIKQDVVEFQRRSIRPFVQWNGSHLA